MFNDTVIEKVHGLQATSLSLNERFTMLQAAAPDRVLKPRRRPSNGSFFNQNANSRNRFLIEQIARRLEWQAKRQALRQRLGTLRRFGSESSLPGLQRSNSFGNLSQASVKNRVAWRQSNGNFNRSWSFGSVSGGAWRGFRRRGGGQRALRGRFRGGGYNRNGTGRVTRVARRARPGGPGGMRGGRGQGRGQGRGRGRGMTRTQNVKPVPTKEELDEQLEQYMAGSKAALDKDLDQYMKNAMDLE